MAESQDFAPWQATEITAIANGLSRARFAEYLSAANNDPAFAVQLYLWNARLAKAFLFPLGMCEVVVRNAIDAAFRAAFNPDWILAPPFPLNVHSQASYSKAYDRLAKDGAVTPDDLVAALPFDFWSNLLRQDYATLWSTPGLLGACFPNLPADEGRVDCQRRARIVNRLRNRIAHHEPIHNRQDHGPTLSVILELIGLVDQDVRALVRRHTTVMQVARVPPSHHVVFPGRPLAQANLRPPPVLAETDSIETAIAVVSAARPQFALVAPDSAGDPYRGVTLTSLLAYIADQAAQAGGLVDLSDHAVAEVLAAHVVMLDVIDVRSTTGDAMAKFFPADRSQPTPAVLLITAVAGAVAGAILRPEIRF